MAEQDAGTGTREEGSSNVNLNPLYREAWNGFRRLFIGYSRDSRNTPLTMKIDGQECPVLEIRTDGTARVEGPSGEMDFQLTPAHITPLYAQLARECDLAFPSGEDVKAKTAGAGVHDSGV